MPVLEAMAAGAAVVTSDIPSVREVAAGHAKIVPPRDAGTLADALRNIEPATEEVRKALKAAAREYSWESSGSILRNTLSDLAKRVGS